MSTRAFFGYVLGLCILYAVGQLTTAIVAQAQEVEAADAYLYVVLHRGTRLRTKMPSTNACFQALAAARLTEVKDPDSGGVVVMWCAGEEVDRHYGGKWWPDGTDED